MTSTRQVPLRKLFQGIPVEVYSSVPEVFVRGVTLDSRLVQPGDLFVALVGGQVDGHAYIPDAIQRGAVAVVGTQPLQMLAAPYVQVGHARQALAYLAAAFYAHPAHKLTVVGVTGTDGKTTTINLIYHILQAAGVATGMVTTVNAVVGNQMLDTGFHVTTPEAPELQRYLSDMVSAGLTHALLEATSHGLAQHRTDGCAFDVGVVTNITHEHLDFHGGHLGYREAKSRLFAGLADVPAKAHHPPRAAVLNRDDSSYGYLAPLVTVRQVPYGMHLDAAVRAEEIQTGLNGLRFQAIGQGYRLLVESQLVGEYNVANCLAAIATAVDVLGVDPDAAREGIAAMPGVPGRMERLDLGQDFIAIVDFAHTPNALHRALTAARSLTPGRLIAVFGSAGLRDREKRRLMAEVSADLADLTILTAEDPRTESLEAILAEMAAGAERRGGGEGQTFWRVPDRGEAIRFAIEMARPGDLVIACGKGHEQSMCFGEVEYAWDDRIAMRSALAERLGIPGPEMPQLPTQETGR